MTSESALLTVIAELRVMVDEKDKVIGELVSRLESFDGTDGSVGLSHGADPTARA